MNRLNIVISVLAFLFGLSSLNSISAQNKGDGNNDPQLVSEIKKFLITKEELNLSFKYTHPERKLSFKNYKGNYFEWKNDVLRKFAELIAYEPPQDRPVNELRTMTYGSITYHALVMQVSPQLTIPAYLLVPEGEIKGEVMAVHGHGMVEPVIGTADDYHHRYAYELAKAGYMVLCPELRGFSTLGDLSNNIDLDNLDYWVYHGRQFTLITEGFQHGKTLIGETIADLLAWENWWAKAWHVERFDVAGISYGGDLVLYYPVFSERVRKIFLQWVSWIIRGYFCHQLQCTGPLYTRYPAVDGPQRYSRS